MFGHTKAHELERIETNIESLAQIVAQIATGSVASAKSAIATAEALSAEIVILKRRIAALEKRLGCEQ